MVDEVILERRLVALERAVADLQQHLGGTAISATWLDKVIGSISDETAFLEALKLGRAMRDADRPPDVSGDQP